MHHATTALAAGLFTVGRAAPAQAPAREATPPKVVLDAVSTAMPRSARQQGHILTATMAPGDSSLWHTHAYPVWAYTSSGDYLVEFQDGRPPISVPAGQAILEPVHAVIRARNAGREPAVLVLFQVTTPGTPFLRPAVGVGRVARPARPAR